MCVLCVCMDRPEKDNDQRTFFPPKTKSWPSRNRRTAERNVENQGKQGKKVAPLSLANNCRRAGELTYTPKRIFQGTLETFKRRHNKIKRILRISCKLSCPHPCFHAPFCHLFMSLLRYAFPLIPGLPFRFQLHHLMCLWYPFGPAAKEQQPETTKSSTESCPWPRHTLPIWVKLVSDCGELGAWVKDWVLRP